MNLSDLLSPDFKIKTLVLIPGTSSRGILESNVELKSYYLDEIRRNKVFIEPIFKLANNIVEDILNDVTISPIIINSFDKNLFIDNILKELLNISLGYSEFIKYIIIDIYEGISNEEINFDDIADYIVEISSNIGKILTSFNDYAVDSIYDNIYEYTNVLIDKIEKEYGTFINLLNYQKYLFKSSKCDEREKFSKRSYLKNQNEADKAFNKYLEYISQKF